MTMNKFDQIIASKLNVADYSAEESVWLSIEKQLPKHTVSAPNISVSFYSGIAAAALMLLGLASLPTISEINEYDPIVLAQTPAMQEENNSIVKRENETAFVTSNEPKPQERHEITLMPLENGTPAFLPSKKSNNTVDSKTDKSTEHELSDQTIAQESSPASSNEGSKDIDFKATGIQCVENSVHFESIENARNTRWVIDGVYVLEGNSCDFTFDEAGEHEVVMLIDQNNQTISVKKSIQIFEKPSPVISYSVIASQSCFEQTVQLTSMPGINAYSWTYNNKKVTGSEVSIKAPGGRHNVILAAVSPEGCVANVTQEVFVEGGLKIFVPNSFTPDNDGHNDVWFANGLEKCASFNVQIYRAADQSLVYETNELAPWNGNLNRGAEKAQRGDKFVYRIQATDHCGFVKEISGTITSL